MMSLVFFSLVTSAILVADVTAQCDEGWSFFKEGNKCIRAYRDLASWDDAKSQCVRQDGRLLIIPNPATEEFVENLVKGSNLYYFIGLSDEQEESRFRWVDGTIPTYFNWGSGQPDDTDGNEDCIHLRADLRWNDIACWKPMQYICEKQGPGCKHKNGGCRDICTNSGDGGWEVICSTEDCKPGYARINGTCYDVDECSVNNGGCDHFCINLPGTWKCMCDTNGRRCLPDGTYIID